MKNKLVALLISLLATTSSVFGELTPRKEPDQVDSNDAIEEYIQEVSEDDKLTKIAKLKEKRAKLAGAQQKKNKRTTLVKSSPLSSSLVSLKQKRNKLKSRYALSPDAKEAKLITIPATGTGKNNYRASIAKLRTLYRRQVYGKSFAQYTMLSESIKKSINQSFEKQAALMRSRQQSSHATLLTHLRQQRDAIINVIRATPLQLTKNTLVPGNAYSTRYIKDAIAEGKRNTRYQGPHQSEMIAQLKLSSENELTLAAAQRYVDQRLNRKITILMEKARGQQNVLS